MTLFLPRRVISICVLALALPLSVSSQESKLALEKPPAAAAPESPFTIERLETRVRFEADGASRREVHTVVKINSETGARQFSRLHFDYNRAFEQIEIPVLRILHANGGSTEVLPSAIADQPNPAVVDAPAYHDVRRKSVRILGLAPGDTLEYRVVTGVTHPPLAPDFYFTHSFSHAADAGVESVEIDLPASRQVQMAAIPLPITEKSGEGADARILYRWSSATGTDKPPHEAEALGLTLTTFSSWEQLSSRLASLLRLPESASPEVATKIAELAGNTRSPQERVQAIYEFVSQRIRTVDIPPGTTGFHPRPPAEILASGYATPEDKLVLFSAMAGARVTTALVATGNAPEGAPPTPSAFHRVVALAAIPSINFWLDPSLEVLPFRMISSQLRGKRVLLLRSEKADAGENIWETIPAGLPFPATQHVSVSGSLSAAGNLALHVKYALRGDNELLLRIAFHRAAREQWKGLAQLLSLSDGFRGEVSNVRASDPLATREPFTVEYDITQTHFVNWSKRRVRLPIPLPTLGLPEAPAKARPSDSQRIDLGTPLEVETRVALRLPPSTTTRAPVPTAVNRDYAEFASVYAVRKGVLTASRRLKFLLHEIPASSAADYAAFVHAVQNDEAQEFLLERAKATAAPSRPATPRKPN